jgi:NAD-dependent deacetylase
MLNYSNTKKIVILTGAGISAESGIKTFRDSNGLWEEHKIEDVASSEGFARDPQLVYNFYNKRREQLSSSQVKPNAAHMALAKLEKEFSGDMVIITQNVDNLHERGDSQNILHMHGELTKMRCSRTNQIYSIEGELDDSTICPCCEVEGHLRPHIVWFGEMPLYMDQIEEYLSTCDLFISIGTSGQVYPAAMFVRSAKQYADAYTIELNLESTEQSSIFDESIMGKASEIVPKFVDHFLPTK